MPLPHQVDLIGLLDGNLDNQIVATANVGIHRDAVAVVVGAHKLRQSRKEIRLSIVELVFYHHCLHPIKNVRTVFCSFHITPNYAFFLKRLRSLPHKPL